MNVELLDITPNALEKIGQYAGVLLAVRIKAILLLLGLLMLFSVCLELVEFVLINLSVLNI